MRSCEAVFTHSVLLRVSLLSVCSGCVCEACRHTVQRVGSTARRGCFRPQLVVQHQGHRRPGLFSPLHARFIRADRIRVRHAQHLCGQQPVRCCVRSRAEQVLPAHGLRRAVAVDHAAGRQVQATPQVHGRRRLRMHRKGQGEDARGAVGEADPRAGSAQSDAARYDQSASQRAVTDA